MKTISFNYEGVPFAFDFADNGDDSYDCTDMRVGGHSVGHLWDGPFPAKLEAMARDKLDAEIRAERRQEQERRAEQRAWDRLVWREAA